MRKILSFVAILLVMVSAFTCGKEKENEITSLEGTKWKLAGIVDMQTGEMTELEPKDCEQCYMLVFDTDSTAWGKSVINDIYVDLSKPFMTVPTYAYDHKNGDVQLFYDTMGSIGSYKVEKNQLKFFYNSNKNYLLFKRIKP
jgi:hypothetical protein